MLRSFIGVAICALYIVMAASTAQAIELLEGLSGKYPNDDGIANDPAVLFTENFERGNLSEWQEKKGTASLTMEHAHSGHASLAIPMARGKSTGGHLVK